MRRELGTALLVLGHGSSKHPDSSRSVRRHAESLRGYAEFSDVYCAFLKEEPFIDDNLLDSIQAEQICIIPDFLAEGYFTRQVIPKKLNLVGQGDRVKYCPPVGTHPLMVSLIGDAAAAVLGDWKVEETSLLVVGHGSTKNSCSKQTLKSHLEDLRAEERWGQIADIWLEEPPKVSEWHEVATEHQVVVLPFLLNDGQHGGWDIPADLGIEIGGGVHGFTHRLQGCDVRLAPALGKSPRFAEVIQAIAQIWG